ncbi:hypothetical protein C2G38_2138826 [Gigaspora rosea]|uniref:Uncharacterized protein n=1 Tax=Gigaspora rosea TaxID=44941 RepID=A0A397VTP7_9GLOM|nr:hypothetical protein C2G38_2138826 [Gigaspora rosea]
MTNIYNYHLKRRILANINWYQFFCNWLEQPNTIIELRSALQLIYPIEYEIGEQKFRAWKAMLKNVGCFDITPYEKDQSKFEFWSRSITPDSDRSSLSTLYDLGFVTSAPLYPSTNAFWNSFHNSLEINKCGIDGRRRVLSIIANDFNYEIIKENLGVLNDLIRAA